MLSWIDPYDAAKALDKADVHELARRVPPVADRLLIELVNGIDVSVDVLEYRPRGGIMTTLLDVVTGRDSRRQTLVAENLVEGERALTSWMLELTDSQRITTHGLAIAADRLRRTSALVDCQQVMLTEHGAAIHELARMLTTLALECDRRFSQVEERVHAVELRIAATEEIDRAVGEWRDGQTYAGLDRTLGALLVGRQVVAGTISNYELTCGRHEPRDRLRRTLVEPVETAGVAALADLLDDIAASSFAFDQAVVSEILRCPFGTPVPIPSAPYVWAIAAACELASLPREARPPSPGACAVALVRRHMGRVDSTSTPRLLVERALSELGDAALVTLESAMSYRQGTIERSQLASPMGNTGITVLSDPDARPQPESREGVPASGKDRVGLVLCGGGARGAFQLGVLDYLAECGFAADAVAGTSIGALNGSVIASASTLADGVNRLADLWSRLGEAIGAEERATARQLDANLAQSRAAYPAVLEEVVERLVSPLLKPDIVESLISMAIDVGELRHGSELWVTAFPLPDRVPPGLPWILDVAETLLSEGAEWFHVQDYIDDGIALSVILASAALPVVTPARKIRGRAYVDGGLRADDNTPIKPLTATCTHVVVSHLKNGSLWNRHDHPGPAIVEVRPKEDLYDTEDGRVGYFEALVDFSPERVADLRARGYRDAKATIEAVSEAIGVVSANRAAVQRGISAVSSLP